MSLHDHDQVSKQYENAILYYPFFIAMHFPYVQYFSIILGQSLLFETILFVHISATDFRILL